MGVMHGRVAVLVVSLLVAAACGSPGDGPSISSSLAPPTSSPSSDHPASVFASPPMAPPDDALPAGPAFATSDVLGHIPLDVSDYCGVCVGRHLVP